MQLEEIQHQGLREFTRQEAEPLPAAEYAQAPTLHGQRERNTHRLSQWTHAHPYPRTVCAHQNEPEGAFRDYSEGRKTPQLAKAVPPSPTEWGQSMKC